MTTTIRRVLVANRGEIACRIIRTCSKLGIHTVAVYSDADRNSLHVRMADQAVHIGPSPSRDSYLNIERIIKAAIDSGADAIHPGYGFLSENDRFSEGVEKAGLIFIGPTAYSIRMMGNKLAAKKAARDFSIPMVPGSDEAITDINDAISIANKAGFPLLIKAAAGGGGKGMRVVNTPDELQSQVDRAMSEALSSFGDGSVFIEKYVSSPRHIEIQVMADQHGNIIHLFERECSIQRRHQKIIEEAPSSILSSEQRKMIGEHAVLVARSCKYTGAGTVEFLLDEKGNHYFLEMNTRLQVEHPVTEMITGLDLVEWQIKIAEGHPLPLSQDEIQMNGHSIELRVYAENVKDGFIPSTGKLIRYQKPSGEGIRVDDGYEAGMEIPVHYDPMISKLIVHGNNRNDAIRKMTDAITDYEVQGVETTLGYGKFAINHPDFVSGNFDTHFVEKNKQDFLQDQSAIDQVAATFTAWLYEKKKKILVLPKMDENHLT